MRPHPIPRLALFLSAALSAAPLSPAKAATAGAPVPGAPASAAAPAAASAGAAPDSAARRDPFLAPPPGAPPADSAASAPMQEAVKLSVHGAFSNTAPRVGDSLDYTVALEWEDTQVPVVVLAPDSVEFPGFRILGQATQHKKLADGRSVRNHTEFIYALRAASQGPGKAISLKVRYLTGLSQREEAVFVPAALVDIGPAPVRLLDMLWFKILLWLLILAAAVAAGWASFRLASRKRKAAQPQRDDLRPEVDALKARLRTAQNNPEASKSILLEMEALATLYLREETGDAQARFETLVDLYLSKGRDGGARPGDAPPSDGAADWAKLKELFRHARFAGGYKEPHELQDAFRTLRKCLKLQAEDES